MIQISPLDESTKQRFVTMGPCFRVCAKYRDCRAGCPDVLLPATLLYLDIRRPGPCTGPGPYTSVHHIISTFYIETCLRITPKIIVFDTDTQYNPRSIHDLVSSLLWDRGKTSVWPPAEYTDTDNLEMKACCGCVGVWWWWWLRASSSPNIQIAHKQNLRTALHTSAPTQARLHAAFHHPTTAGWWGFNYVKK